MDAGISSVVYAPNTSNHKRAVIMKRSLVVSAVLTCLVTGSAMAADMPLKASPVARAGCAQFGGFYLGAQAGAASYSNTFNDLDAFGVNNVSSRRPQDVSHTGRGALAGAQAGYNWQSGCTVFGIESDWAWTGAKASTLLSNGDSSPRNLRGTLPPQASCAGSAPPEFAPV